MLLHVIFSSLEENTENRNFLLYVRIFVLSLRRLHQLNSAAMKVELTEKENDLIQAIRNYRKSYVFSGRQIEEFIEKTLAELMAGEEWQTLSKTISSWQQWHWKNPTKEQWRKNWKTFYWPYLGESFRHAISISHARGSIISWTASTATASLPNLPKRKNSCLKAHWLIYLTAYAVQPTQYNKPTPLGVYLWKVLKWKVLKWKMESDFEQFWTIFTLKNQKLITDKRKQKIV